MRPHHVAALLVTLHLAIGAACEVSTKVAISNPAVPPTFKLSGNGYLYHFIVVGPYASERDLALPATNVDVIWQLSPEEDTNARVDDLPTITYGQVPRGFKQDMPSEGSPRALEPGKYYSIGSPSIRANFEGFCFKVESATVVEVACVRRL